jgi:tetratricopeptide (TPR) repeat protein
VITNLGRAYAGRGLYAEAEESYRLALNLLERKFGPYHPNVAVTLECMALLRRKEANFEEAQRLFQQAIKIQETALGLQHPKLAVTLEEYAELLRRMNLKRQAATISLRASTIRQQAERSLLAQPVDVRALKD